MLLNILLVILVLDCIALVAVILLQQSEGGALGMGGGPTGMFTARGAGDLLTKTTQILAGVFFVLALLITLLGSYTQRNSSVVRGLKLDTTAPLAVPKPAAQPGPANSSAPPPLPGAPAPSAAPPLPGAPAPSAAPPLPGGPAPSAAAPLPGAPAPSAAPASRPARIRRAPAHAAAASPTTPAPASPAQSQPAPAASTPAASQ